MGKFKNSDSYPAFKNKNALQFMHHSGINIVFQCFGSIFIESGSDYKSKSGFVSKLFLNTAWNKKIYAERSKEVN